ncbi:nuclear envelope morphology protein 1 [Roseibium sp. TrichSKD4]|nr:nuclear envelope morphology protein 1 [Roseibium sp. TrichSKD4]
MFLFSRKLVPSPFHTVQSKLCVHICFQPKVSPHLEIMKYMISLRSTWSLSHDQKAIKVILTKNICH